MSRGKQRSCNHAEKRLRTEGGTLLKSGEEAENIQALTAEESQRLIHELRVHQIELEMQNEELRRAQLEIDAARERYFDLFHQAPVGYVTLSETGLILEANLTAINLLGVAHGAMIQKPITRFIVKEDQDIYYLHCKKLLATGESQTFDLRMLKAGETPFWAQLVSTATKDFQGTDVRRVVLRNVTQRKQTIEALEETNERLRAITEHAAAVIFLKDTDGRYLFANRLFETSLQRERGEIIGKTDYDLFPPDRAEVFRRNDQTVMDSGQPLETEEWVPEPDGLHASLSIKFPLRKPSGEIYAVGGIATDITGRKRVAEETRRLVELLDFAPSSITVHDFEGNYLYANQRTLDMHGYTREAFIALKLHQVDVPESAALIAPRLQELRDKGEAVFEVEHLRKDGSILPLEIFARTTMWDDQPVILSVGSDITERRRAREALARVHAELERRVIARTEEVRRLAVEATLVEERERHTIARDLHDDLGQLLHVAKLKLGGLARLEPTGPGAVLVKELDDILGTASQTVRSLSSQLCPPVLETLGLVPSVYWLGEELEHTYGILVHVTDAGAPEPATQAQAIILFRAVRELLINVAKHAGTREAWVNLATEGEILVIQVRDQGQGMNLDHVMQETRGFGLRSIRERLLQMDGELSIQSSPGTGTRVVLRMPPPSRSLAPQEETP